MATVVKLSNGQEVEVKPLTMRQAKEVGFSRILRGVAKAMGEVGENEEVKFNLAEMEVSDEDMYRLVKVVCPQLDIDNLPYADVFELFIAIVNESAVKK